MRVSGWRRVVAWGVLLWTVPAGCNQPRSPHEQDPAAPAPTSAAAVRRFCGDCHAFPQPETYPRHEWPEKVRDGFNFYSASLRSDLEVPPVAAVEQFYASRAPVELAVPASTRRSAPPEESLFAAAQTYLPAQPLRAVSHLRAVAADDALEELLICDMGAGNVWRVPGMARAEQPLLLGRCLNPAHAEAVDLDGDGRRDYIVADLGSFLPEDHDFGAVWYFRAEEPGAWTPFPLIEGIGRVADARPLDADGDGDLDVVVAEFGWRATGRILLLRNDPTPEGLPRMTSEVIDQRHGAIHVPVTDVNGDGRPDFVALISQEHETIDAFLNLGEGRFERKRIFQSDNPGFGSSGIQLADMDGDGDLDVLFVNGDSLDTPIAKPYHGVRWLENAGAYPYPVHEICKLPGGHCLRAADLDRDGDMDVAVVALVPGKVVAERPPGTFDSVVWLEQQPDGSFLGHRLEADNPLHAACELADWDGDGDLDLIVADLSPDPRAQRPLTIFRNRTLATGADRSAMRLVIPRR